jgi:hypothetical protein
MPKTDKVLPSLASDLIERELPRCTKSRHETPLPQLIIPYAEIALPRRTNDRTDIALPNDRKSKTVIFSPNLAWLNTDIPDAHRVYARRDKELPRVVLSKSENEDPHLRNP